MSMGASGRELRPGRTVETPQLVRWLTIDPTIQQHGLRLIVEHEPSITTWRAGSGKTGPPGAVIAPRLTRCARRYPTAVEHRHMATRVVFHRHVITGAASGDVHFRPSRPIPLPRIAIAGRVRCEDTRAPEKHDAAALGIIRQPMQGSSGWPVTGHELPVFPIPFPRVTEHLGAVRAAKEHDATTLRVVDHLMRCASWRARGLDLAPLGAIVHPRIA